MKTPKRLAWIVVFTIVAFNILTSCTTTAPKTIVQVVERKVEVPNSLLTCDAEPIAGSRNATSRGS